MIPFLSLSLFLAWAVQVTESALCKFEWPIEKHITLQ